MVIPDSFESWKACIEVRCGIPLTREFVLKRMAVYGDENLQETKKFVQLYGETHRLNILKWLNEALSEL